MPASTTGWFPVLTLVLGYAIKYVGDLIQDRRMLRREREGRAEARRDQLRERRSDFQRQTLLDLQEAIGDLMRTTGQTHMEDMKNYRQTGEWQKQLLGEPLNENDRLAMRRTMILGVRARDDSIRQMSDRLREQAAAATIALSPSAGTSAITSMGETFIELNQRIGEALRRLDDEETRELQSP